MYQCKWPLCVKIAVLVLVWCYKTIGDREQYLWRYWLPECCIKQCYDKPVGDCCFCKKCGLREELSSDIPVSCTLLKCTDVQYANTRLRNSICSPHWPDSPFTQQITLCFLYCFWGLWAFYQAFILLTYVASTKIGNCELDTWCIIHILSFITPHFLPICLMIIDALAIFQARIWV